MALQGTIKDFGLGDIFQLIGIQRKTGVLSLESGQEGVSVKFLEGQVVGADTRSHTVEDLLGAVLVRTGRITEAQLQRALKVQKNTLQRLGHILVKQGLISGDDLIEALRVQSLQIVYRLFRWREGRYRFHTSDSLDYDDKHFAPISAETILMEGARMVDEWPIIERRIKSDNMVFRKTEAAERLELDLETMADPGLDFEFNFDRQENEAQEKPQERAIKLSAEEREVLALVDGRRSVAEINDHSNLGEFDTYRALAELATRNLIEEVKRATAAEAARRKWRFPERVVQAGMYVLVLLLAASGVGTLRGNALTPWSFQSSDPTTAQLRTYASQERLERLGRAIHVFYLDTGAFPDRLELLVGAGYLRAGDLLDPWRRPYGYRLFAGGYQLYGLDAEGRPDERLTASHRFSPVQRMMQEPAP